MPVPGIVMLVRISIHQGASIEHTLKVGKDQNDLVCEGKGEPLMPWFDSP